MSRPPSPNPGPAGPAVQPAGVPAVDGIDSRQPLALDWLRQPGLQRALGLLSSAGHRALVVGGAVRNAVMGLAPGDLDISTDARPDRVQALAEAAGLRQVPTGIEHGTVTVIVGGEPFEITTFRRDVQTDGRRAVVAFADTIAEDARRRDFTMNALYLEADGRLIDPLGGLPDARARRVRFIEDPGLRIREDYLRILRFFRFYAWYGDTGAGIDAEGLAACAEHAEGLDLLSRERVGAELLKLLSAPDPAPAMAAFAATGGLARILPGADPAPLAVLVALEAGRPAEPLRRLAAIGGVGDGPGAEGGNRDTRRPDTPDADSGAPQGPGQGAAAGGRNAPGRGPVAAALRLSKQQAKDLALIRAAALEGTDPAETAWRHGPALALDAALVRAALLGQPLAPDLEARIQAAGAAVFPVSAADLAARHQGPALGAALKRLQAAWIGSGFALDRAALLALADPAR